jgi:hypothetical protein
LFTGALICRNLGDVSALIAFSQSSDASITWYDGRFSGLGLAVASDSDHEAGACRLNDVRDGAEFIDFMTLSTCLKSRSMRRKLPRGSGNGGLTELR